MLWCITVNGREWWNLSTKYRDLHLYHLLGIRWNVMWIMMVSNFIFLIYRKKWSEVKKIWILFRKNVVIALVVIGKVLPIDPVSLPHWQKKRISATFFLHCHFIFCTKKQTIIWPGDKSSPAGNLFKFLFASAIIFLIYSTVDGLLR